jgi:hypothetical protein
VSAMPSDLPPICLFFVLVLLWNGVVSSGS